jgi:AsmA protein
LLRRLERRPLSGGNEFRSGRTPFDNLSVQVKIAKGQATVEEVTLRSSGVKLEIAGAASIPTRDLDLKGVATLVATSAADKKLFELPFVVQGPWDDPLMLPDAQSLIQRSGAAAPLLDALRGRNERDALRPDIAPVPPPAAMRPPAARETEAAAPAAAPENEAASPAPPAPPRSQEAAAPLPPQPSASNPAADEPVTGRDGAPEPAPAMPSPAPAAPALSDPAPTEKPAE